MRLDLSSYQDTTHLSLEEVRAQRIGLHVRVEAGADEWHYVDDGARQRRGLHFGYTQHQ